MAERVNVFEMGPRDGLQNEKRLIPTAEKIALVDLLSQAGFDDIEVTSFVPAAWVPQMADGAEVMAGIDALFDLFRAGRLDPVAGATLPLDDLAQGYAMLRERRSVGKVVITL